MKLVDPTRGIASTAVSSLMAPTGSGACDIYLVADPESVVKFNNRQCEKPSYLLSGTRENFIHGVVLVRDVTRGTCFLALRNPSGSMGVYVNVEVVAIVAERAVAAKQPEQSGAELYGNLGWKVYQGGEYDKRIELSKKALELDGTLGWVQCNIALTCLVTSRPEAMDEYVKAIELVKKSSRARDFFAGRLRTLMIQSRVKVLLKMRILFDRC